MCILDFEMPETLSFFNVNGTNKFARFVAEEWDSVFDLLSIPDMMGGLQGLRPSLRFSPNGMSCKRLCLMAVMEVVRVMRESCGEVNRGHLSALVSAYAEFTEVMGFLLSTFSCSSFFPPQNRRKLLSFDSTIIAQRSSLIYSRRSEYPAFARRVADSVAQQFTPASSVSSYWLESPCLSSSSSF